MNTIKYLKQLSLLLVVLLIIGCNPNAKEKKRLSVQMKKIRTRIAAELEKKEVLVKTIRTINYELESEQTKKRNLFTRLENYRTELSQLQLKKTASIAKKAKCQYDLGEFVMNHKMATLSLVAAGGGIAATIEDNLDEDTKSILQGLGVVGALYCLMNADECTRVTAKIAYYGTEISRLSDEIPALEERIYEYANEIERLNPQYTEYERNVDALKAKLVREQNNDNTFTIEKLRMTLNEKRAIYDSL